MKTFFQYFSAAVLYGAWLVCFGQIHHTAAISEPDNAFHLAMARSTVEEGLVRRIPQVEDLTWSADFSNPYFLFTQLGALAWRVGGEQAVFALVPILGTLLFLVLFGFCRRYMPWYWALLLPLFLLWNVSSVNRYLCFRPSLLATAELIGMVLAIVAGRRWLVGLCAALFALSYHAHYLAVFILGSAAIIGWYFRMPWPRYALWGVAGLVGGTVINPYFPGTLGPIVEVFRIFSEPSAVPFTEQPIELMGWSLETLLSRLPICFGLVLMSAWILGRERQKAHWKRPVAAAPAEAEVFLLTVLAGAFCILMLVSFRAIEYFLPFCVILAAAFWKAQTSRSAGWMVALGLLVLFPQIRQLVQHPLLVVVEPQSLQAALNALPATPGKKVYNSEWYLGGPLLYHRPDLRFVDLGDPKALDQFRPGMSGLKSKIRSAEVPYAYGAIRFAFGADYTVSQYGPLTEALDKSPLFRRLYPPPNQPITPLGFATYELRDKLDPAFVMDWESSGRDLASDWKPAVLPSQVAPEQRSPMFNAGRWMEGSGENCTFLRPSENALAAHSGATWLGVGGGPEVEISYNGEVLLSRKGRAELALVDRMLPLPRPLRPTDSLVFKVCEAGAGFAGLAASLWTAQSLSEVCAWKGVSTDMGNARFSDGPFPTCLAPIAAVRPQVARE
ncbi:hypothetical protein K2X33_04020 [bacterium]|nr:hypothetical protein [bacterium]